MCIYIFPTVDPDTNGCTPTKTEAGKPGLLTLPEKIPLRTRIYTSQNPYCDEMNALFVEEIFLDATHAHLVCHRLLYPKGLSNRSSHSGLAQHGLYLLLKDRFAPCSCIQSEPPTGTTLCRV